MTNATRFRGTGAARPVGVWGPKALTYGQADISALSCHRTKVPKMTTNKTTQTERKNMNNNKFKNKTKQILKGGNSTTILITLAISTMLTGCASMNQHEESIGDILEKENTLIGKVQAERATPDVQQGISQNASLKVSEDHLSLALQELLKANEVITTKLIQQNEKEVDFDRFGGRGH
jgi:hypothetical protein